MPFILRVTFPWSTNDLWVRLTDQKIIAKASVTDAEFLRYTDVTDTK